MKNREMSKIIDEICINEYLVLKLDSMPKAPHKKYRIDGVDFEPIPVYDAINCIAIISYGHFIGNTVEFI